MGPSSRFAVQGRLFLRINRRFNTDQVDRLSKPRKEPRSDLGQFVKTSPVGVSCQVTFESTSAVEVSTRSAKEVPVMTRSVFTFLSETKTCLITDQRAQREVSGGRK